MAGKTAAVVLGVIFLAVGLLGFVPNPLIGTNAYFAATTSLDLLRVVIGLILLGVGLWSPARSVLWIRVLAFAYIAGALFSFAATSSLSASVGGNTAGSWLHIILGLLLIITALGAKKETA